MVAPETLERSLTLEQAKARGFALAERLGLAPKFTRVGEVAHCVLCRLFNDAGREVSSGLGKGGAAAAEVGALYEALEHRLNSGDMIDRSLIVFKDVGSAFSKPGPGLPSVLTGLLAEQPKATLACLNYQKISTSGDAVSNVPFPVALMCPTYLSAPIVTAASEVSDTFDYEPISRYASNSGCAIGANFEEAAIHGTMEAVERDAIARFLFDNFFLFKKDNLRRVPLDSLPDDVRDYARHVSHEIGASIRLYAIPTRFPIPCFCAWIETDTNSVHSFGFGASLDSRTAAYRSLSEVTQIFQGRALIHGPEDMRRFLEDRIYRVRDEPGHLRAVMFDLGAVEARAGSISVDFNELPSPVSERVELSSYLETASNLIEQQGSEVWATKLFEDPETGISVVHSMLSDPDYFHLAYSGMLVMPCYPERSSEGLPDVIRSRVDRMANLARE